LLLAAVIVAVAGSAAPASGDEDEPELTVVASGLDNPRGLDIRGGAVFVAEAGRGGDGICVMTPQGAEECLGSTGAVTRIDRRGQRRVLSELASLAGATEGFAVGPTTSSTASAGC